MRVCFLLKVKQQLLEEYKRRHADVWPEMLQALQASGWHNYSLFLRPDGLLVGYLEKKDAKKFTKDPGLGDSSPARPLVPPFESSRS